VRIACAALCAFDKGAQIRPFADTIVAFVVLGAWVAIIACSAIGNVLQLMLEKIKKEVLEGVVCHTCNMPQESSWYYMLRAYHTCKM
jgi:hypothetical protein